MKALLFTLLLLTASARARECRGEDPCRACRDCSACSYCSPQNPKGGSCGVLRAQTAAEREKAAARRQKAPK